MSKLIIVESPAKARTIEKYLGKDYKVAASVGHVVDLPQKELGVEIEKDFKPKYVVMPDKKKAVASLRKAAGAADEIYLAPDPDREGEAIAWHIAELLKKSGKPMRRVLINEITKPAVVKAIENAGEIDQDRFEAQQARRILDRLVGYLISPMLSKKLRGSLSAGRVQSVALRLVVERERAIRAFSAKEYWSLDALLEAALPPEFSARLVAIEGKTLDTPEKFDRETNAYVAIDLSKNAFIADEDRAKAILAELEGKAFKVGEVNKQERRRNPAPPFITSTLQQEAARKFGFTAKKTMMLAQRLYEGQDVGDGAVGLITYMRTDAPRIADEAKAMARSYIERTYGKEYLPAKPPVYKSKKGAQEAHEAIRPTSTGRTPEAVKQYLDADMWKLYQLVFMRFCASQMKPAVYDQTAVEIPVDKYLFRASGRVIKFKGFLSVYEEAADEDDAESNDNPPLPELKEGDELKLRELKPEQHFTKPPPRFTEASLVREMEEKGIGRPSTYAQTLSTIQDRTYVEKDKNRFEPTPLGERIIDVLVEAFPDIFEVGFTAMMEEDLDKVEDGKEKWVETLRRFYTPFSSRLEAASEIIDEMKQEEPTDIPCSECGSELMIKWSKRGEFIGCSAYPDCRFTADFERTEDGGIKILERAKAEETDIKCDKCGSPMVIKKTRKGGREFLACSGYPKCKNAKDFTRGDGGSILPVEKPEPEDTGIKCEKCNSPMVIKAVRRTGKEFLACSGYPKCRNAKDFLRNDDGSVRVIAPGDEGPPCEKCGKPAILKRGRGGATYWLCQNDDCEESKKKPKAQSKPQAEPMPDEPPCEKCGSPMVQRQGRYGPFIACSGYPKCKNIRKKKKDGKEAAKK